MLETGRTRQISGFKEYRNVKQKLKAEIEQLEQIIKTAGGRLQKAPEGSVRMIRHGKGYQFYLREDPADKNGRYLDVSRRKLAITLIQKKYDCRVLAAAQKQLSEINRFLKRYDPDWLKKIYDSLPGFQRGSIIPFEISDMDYIIQWNSCVYERKPFADGAPVHHTGKGVRVRSKSEVMIANALEAEGIPYRYEYPLKLDGIWIHPDFTVLRKSDRKEFLWEHLGMMDDAEYCQRALQRIWTYENNGIMPGRDLILTSETSRHPLNLSVIRKYIQLLCV